MPLEAPIRPRTRWRDLLRDAGTVYTVNGLIGFLFAATGPVAVILSVGLRGGLSESDLASWIFGAFFVNFGHGELPEPFGLPDHAKFVHAATS